MFFLYHELKHAFMFFLYHNLKHAFMFFYFIYLLFLKYAFTRFINVV